MPLVFAMQSDNSPMVFQTMSLRFFNSLETLSCQSITQDLNQFLTFLIRQNMSKQFPNLYAPWVLIGVRVYVITPG